VPFVTFFYAHGHPKEICQQKLIDVRRTSRGRWIFTTRVTILYEYHYCFL